MRPIASALLAAVAAGLAPSARAQLYTVKDLGAIGTGKESAAYAINAKGHVAGWAEVESATDVSRAFLFGGGLPVGALGTLGGDYGEAHGLNQSDDAVGFEYLPGTYHFHAVLYRSGSGTATQITPTGNPRDSAANAIDPSGKIVGWWTTAFDEQRAFVWTPPSGPLVDRHLEVAPGMWGSYFTAINGKNGVVGYAIPPSPGVKVPPSKGFFYRDGERASAQLGSLGGGQSEPYGINDSDVIVGTSDIAVGGRWHAFKMPAGRMMLPSDDLGVLPGMQSSEAHGISNAGEVVGISTFTSLPSKETPFTVVTRIRKAFLYTDAAKMRDLNALVVPGSPKLVDAQAINDAHQIAGTAEIGGREHAVLLSLCGNGIVESNGGNECDDGSFNGTPGSCCTTSCTRKPMGTVCETDNDKCTGVATCTAMGQCLQTTPDCRFGVSGIPNDSDPCHENPCDPVAGCQSRNIVPCDAAGSTKAFVGGASSVCSGGTIVGTSCALKASNVTLTVPANALPTPVNINAVRLPTSPCVDPRFFPGSFTLFAQETPMEGGRSVIVSGTRFFPASQSFALPVTMQFDWTNPVLTCSAPFDCTVGGAATGQTLEKNLTVDYRRPGSPAPTSLTPPCHTTAGCVSPPPAGYACLVDDVCCKTAGTCTAADTTCDPTLNSWKLNNVRHF